MLAISFALAKKKRLLMPVFHTWCTAAKERGVSGEAIDFTYCSWQDGLTSLLITREDWAEILRKGPIDD